MKPKPTGKWTDGEQGSVVPPKAQVYQSRRVGAATSCLLGSGPTRHQTGVGHGRSSYIQGPWPQERCAVGVPRMLGVLGSLE